jgi:hypothetical protein
MPIMTRWIGSVTNRDPAAPRNDGLVRAIEEIARADSPAARAAFYQALLGSRLVAVRAGNAPEKSLEVVTGPPEPFAFQMLPSPKGKNAVALFTDVDALLAGRPDAKGFVAFEARPLFEAIINVDGGALINSGSPHFAHVSQDDVKRLARGEIPPAVTTARMMQTALPDAEVLEGLKAAMAEDSRIVSAHFFATAVEGKAARNNCGVKFSPDVSASDLDLAMRKLISRVARTTPSAEDFDFVLLNRAGPLSRAEGIFPAFYKRAAL